MSDSPLGAAQNFEPEMVRPAPAPLPDLDPSRPVLMGSPPPVSVTGSEERTTEVGEQIDVRPHPPTEMEPVLVLVPPLVGPRGWRKGAKRAIDLVGSSFLLLLLLPVLAVSAAAIRLSSRGPALFVQDRVGRNGEPFRMFKFRSMRVNAHDDRVDVAHLNEASGPLFKIREDPRLTRVGKVLRRLSIDELPQLLNVLRGDMSLVGPRPPLPEEYSTYGPRQRLRLVVTPGITCIWQVSGRSDLDFDTWVDLDLEYIASWSLLLDVKILLRTIPAVLSGRGAY